MGLNLLDILIVILIPSSIVRLLVLAAIYRKFSLIFGGRKNIVQGSKLFGELELPGFSTFVRMELLLGMLPYLFLFTVANLFDVSTIGLNELNHFALIGSIVILVSWLIIDIIKSVLIYNKMSKVAKDTSRIKNITGSTIDGLRFIIHRRGIVRRTAIKYSVGFAKKKLEEKQEKKKSFLKKISIRGLTTIENITTYPEKITKRLSNWMKEDLDEKLMTRFEKYSKRSKLYVLLNLVWSFLPGLIFTLLYMPFL